MLLLLTTTAFTSCGIGYNRVLFFTKTNAGVDVDPEPPTGEITIARREGVIEPTFEGGQTLPVMASFTSSQNGASRLIGGGVAMTFSTGAAAVVMSREFNNPAVHPSSAVAAAGERKDAVGETADVSDPHIPIYEQEASVFVSKTPEPKPTWLESAFYWVFQCGPREPYGPGETAPLVFGTDSSLGLKALLSGQNTGPTLQFGYRRKELAWTPVTISGLEPDVHDGARTEGQGKAKPAASGESKPETTPDKTDHSGPPPLKTAPTNGSGGPFLDEQTLEVGAKQGVEKQTTNENHASTQAKYRIDIPSLIATSDSDYQASAESQGISTKLKYVQYFATGRAATYLALQPNVRNTLVPRIIPDAKDGTATIIQKNRALAESLASKTAKLAPKANDSGAFATQVTRLNNTAIAVGYIAAITDFDKKTPSEQRDALAAKFLDVSKKDMADLSYSQQLKSLLALFDDDVVGG
jgi:hypothetical protein